MHIPATMLNGAVCPVTMAVSAAGVGLAAYQARRAKEKPSAARFAAVTALIFALQMLNYPVQSGTSGHLVGAMLGVGLLGVPLAALSMAIVLAVQAFLFGDGGINALGANILNMSLIGAGVMGFVFDRMVKLGARKNAALALASFFSVLAGALACSLEVAASGAVALNKVLPAMLSVHALIGIGEAVLTVAVVSVLSFHAVTWERNEKNFALGASALAVMSALVSPLASGFPDGLEWVAGKLSFAEFRGIDIPALFPDYQATFISSEAVSTIAAGLIGVGVVFAITFLTGRLLKGSRFVTV